MGFEQNPLKLDGKTFRKGLALASRTELVYRLPGKFRLFRATAGHRRQRATSRQRAVGDQRRRQDRCGKARSAASSRPRTLELELGGVKRLEILADYGEDLDVGDRLDLGDAQVTK